MSLAAALLYTSFLGSAEARQPSQMASAEVGKSYQLTGRVVKGSVKRDGEILRFRVEDRDGGSSIAVAYSGQVPDPFREGREVIVTVHKPAESAAADEFTGKPDSLITKCPSKFDDGTEDPSKMEWRDSSNRVVDVE
ncbi:MAG: cytochrome c maturation protein CcmE [Patulibacter sp.]|nr:cytochrome c maturation protein CcmE [Patulibacter sp.]